MKGNAMKTLFLWSVVMLASVATGCGGDDKGKGGQPPSGQPPASGTPGAATPPPPPQGPRTATGRKAKSAVPLHNFADENLAIPPFNENARTLPPEVFSEHGKEQRDPFLDLYGLLAIKEAESPSTEPGMTESTVLVLLENFQLNQLTLSGIVWAAGREKALFTDPTGQPTIVMKEDRISRSRALVKEITHDKVLVEVPGQAQGDIPKIMEYSLARTSGPYQVQYEKIRADQRGIRVRMYGKNKPKEVGP
jgi:Tfp pilus assembly protein PilP